MIYHAPRPYILSRGKELVRINHHGGQRYKECSQILDKLTYHYQFDMIDVLTCYQQYDGNVPKTMPYNSIVITPGFNTVSTIYEACQYNLGYLINVVPKDTPTDGVKSAISSVLSGVDRDQDRISMQSLMMMKEMFDIRYKVWRLLNTSFSANANLGIFDKTSFDEISRMSSENDKLLFHSDNSSGSTVHSKLVTKNKVWFDSNDLHSPTSIIIFPLSDKSITGITIVKTPDGDKYYRCNCVMMAISDDKMYLLVTSFDRKTLRIGEFKASRMKCSEYNAICDNSKHCEGIIKSFAQSPGYSDYHETLRHTLLDCMVDSDKVVPVDNK